MIQMLLTAIIVLFLLHLAMIIFTKFNTGREGFFDKTTEMLLTDKQKISMLLLDVATKEDPKMMEELQPLILALIINPMDTLIDTLYNKMKMNQTITKVLKNGTSTNENNGVDFNFEFDDFFNSIMEVFITSGKLQAKDTEKESVKKLETAYNNWKSAKFPTQADKTISGSSPPATDKDKIAFQKLLEQVAGTAPLPQDKGKPSGSGSEAPVTASASLDNLDRPSASVVNSGSASASEIGAVRNTTPGLAQGQDYYKSQQFAFPPPPRCQPQPQQCADSEPIMNDGRPFDPNEYIRKDSIPCWNCNLM